MKTIRVLGLTLITYVALCLAVPGCSSEGGGGPTPTGKLRVLITDKPFPFEFIQEATVTITEVRVHRVGDIDTNGGEDADSNGDDADTNGDDPKRGGNGQGADSNGEEEDDEADSNGDDADTNGDQDGPWFTIFEGEKEFNLLDLRNGRTDLLAEADVPTGTYNQMRLIVTKGEITLTDGRVFPLEVPSGDRSGIKLHFTFEVGGEGDTVLLLDVDLSRAFQPVPGGHIDDPSTIREFHFRPSLAMRLIQILDAGSISGTVTNADSNGMATTNGLAGVAVTAYDESNVDVTSTASATGGTYTLSGLHAGTYRVEFSATGYADAEVTGVAVTAGETTANVNASMTPSP